MGWIFRKAKEDRAAVEEDLTKVARRYKHLQNRSHCRAVDLLNAVKLGALKTTCAAIRKAPQLLVPPKLLDLAEMARPLLWCECSQIGILASLATFERPSTWGSMINWQFLTGQELVKVVNTSRHNDNLLPSFLFVTDAPFWHHPDVRDLPYRLSLPAVHWEQQVLLQKFGTQIPATVVLTLTGSSGHDGFISARTDRSKSKIRRFPCERLPSVQELVFATRSQKGDYLVLTWPPLKWGLQRQDSLLKDHTEFAPASISLYCHRRVTRAREIEFRQRFVWAWQKLSSQSEQSLYKSVSKLVSELDGKALGGHEPNLLQAFGVASGYPEAVRPSFATQPTTPAFQPPEEPYHNNDFTCVKWFGKEFFFRPGSQANVVKLLWDLWEKNERFGLSQKAIGEQLRSEASDFRLMFVFRHGNGKMHDAWGSMIVQGEVKGTYRLQRPLNAITE